VQAGVCGWPACGAAVVMSRSTVVLRKRPVFLVNLFLPSLLFFSASVLTAQTALEDVHVLPQPHAGAETMAAAAIPALPGSLPYVIHKDVDLVLVPVTVTDSQNRLVTGLSRDNFQVFDGKTLQDVRHFSSEDIPLSIGIIVDSSGSMKDKVERVHEAVTRFCESANVEDEFFMITFADVPHLVQDFTNSPDDIEKEMLFVQPKGRTALLDAIYMGLSKMRTAKYAKRALLIVSDGGDNHSRYSEREVKNLLKEADVAVYAIGTFDRYMPTQEELLGPELLSSLAEPTGGRAFTVSNLNDLPEVARQVGIELRAQYVLGYRPSSVPQDGKWHKIHVKLQVPRKLPLLHAHAKTGYYAQLQ
jgi:Ca-activated chloride channel family protein